jgi:hypothetical protein
MSDPDSNTPPPHQPSPIPPQGSYQSPPYTGAPPQTSGKAIASMVLGISSIITCVMYGVPGLVCGILAVIFSKQAMTNVRNGTAPQSSIGMAKAGKVCGWVGISLSLVALLFFIVYIIIFIAILGAAATGAANNPTLLPF